MNFKEVRFMSEFDNAFIKAYEILVFENGHALLYVPETDELAAGFVVATLPFEHKGYAHYRMSHYSNDFYVSEGQHEFSFLFAVVEKELKESGRL